MNRALRFLAGPGATELIRKEGFDLKRIRYILGASGGPKWFVLSQLDRVIATDILPRLQQPVHLVGSSIGAWRMACYAREDPAAAIGQLEASYVDQQYASDADGAQILDVAREWLSVMLGDHGATEVLNHPRFRLSVIAARSRRLSASEQRLPLALGLAAAAGTNAINRRWLGLHFRRSIFVDARTLPGFTELRDGIPTEVTTLTTDNLGPAILASSAIPLLMPGVRNVPGAVPGTYRDGGVVDYHLDLPTASEGELALYPHFSSRLVPGWFDKSLKWRRAKADHLHNTLLLCPSECFVAGLPGGKIPDRTDFQSMSDAQRVRTWRTVIRECERLADELRGVLDSGNLDAALEPLSG